jgi:hypothetical protein
VKATDKAPLLVVIEVIVGAPGGWATTTPVRDDGVKVNVDVFAAPSPIVPEFKSIVVATAIPSASTSLWSLATVYLKTRALVPEPEK